MGKPPTERHRAIFKRRREGVTLTRIATEFATTADLVRQAIKRVEDYDRGVAMLRKDPFSIEALDLVGRLPPHARRALAAQRINRITDLAGVPMLEILKWPNVGQKSATRLLELLEETRAINSVAGSCPG
jgi:hypothetical protein